MESCRKSVKDRILKDILGSVQDGTGGGWRVLILDDFTTRVLSSTVRMSDILDCNVSVVEDLSKKRQPLTQAAIYFIQPTATSIAQLCEDFANKPLYPSVHVFFSSKAPSEGLDRIKSTDALVRVLKTLKEVYLEFLTVDTRTMVTDHPHALITLLGEHCESDRGSVTREVDVITTRLTTLFATLNEFPVIRYKAGKAPEPGDPPGQAVRSSMTQLLSARLIEKLSVMQRQNQLPPRETCDMLVLDRSYDAVAPFIHEWGYEAMVYDLVPLEGNIYRFVTQNAADQEEEREVVLDEATDEVWRELRHAFIADVYTSIAQRMAEFKAKNKAARLGGNKAEAAANLSAMIKALPEFREVLSKLGVHISLSTEIKQVSAQRGLADLGELEQDIVLGDKTSKDLITFLQDNPQLDPSDKMRLMLCYLATHPGKMDSAKSGQWAKVAGLSSDDMAAMLNLAYLGIKVNETAAAPEGKGSGFFGRKAPKPQKLTRKKREDDGEEQYALNRFFPLLLDVLEDMTAGRLSAEEYPYIRPPSEPVESTPAASARTARSGLNWARRPQQGDGPSGNPASRRLVVFVIGGITRSEMRIAHRIAQQTGRDVILGSTSVDTPNGFLESLYHIAEI